MEWKREQPLSAGAGPSGLDDGDAPDPAAAHQPRSPGATAQKTRRGGAAAAAPVERGAREALSGAASAPCPRGALGVGGP